MNAQPPQAREKSFYRSQLRACECREILREVNDSPKTLHGGELCTCFNELPRASHRSKQHSFWKFRAMGPLNPCLVRTRYLAAVNSKEFT